MMSHVGRNVGLIFHFRAIFDRIFRSLRVTLRCFLGARSMHSDFAKFALTVLIDE